MAIVDLPYGKTHMKATIPYEYEKVSISEAELSYTSEEEVWRAIENPIGTSWGKFKGAKNVVIATSDATRPVPNHIIIPLIAKKLAEYGITKDQITILIGTGLHRISPPEEFPQILGEEVARDFKVISHDCGDEENLVQIGTTSRGTPVVLNRYYVEADAKIALGVLDPHQFAGFAGGAKAVAIGLGGTALVNHNHSMLIHPKASLANLEGNPVREDIDEIGGMARLDFIVNVVLNSRKEVVKAVSGHYIEAHRAGVKHAQEILQVPVDKPADLVIAASGGSPKDLNLYQAQKALLHSSVAVKEGGTIILAAECEEGIGSTKFEDTMKLGDTADEVIEEFSKLPFFVGGHKALLWCRSLQKARVILVSDGITAEQAELMKVEKASSIEEAIEMCKDSLPVNPVVACIPKAPSTVPLVREPVLVG
jgi:nickel-dependent lactate racemase